MKPSKLVGQAFTMLTRYKLRSGFIMLGTLIGVAALAFVISIGSGVQRKMLDTMSQLFGASSITVLTGGAQLLGGPRAEAARLTIDDIEAVADEVAGIEIWDPQQAIPAAAIRKGDANSTARILGQSERSEVVWNRSVTAGEYFDDIAVRNSSRVALIGPTVARSLFGTDDPIDQEIMIESVAFTVIGILEPFGTDVHGMDRDNEVVVPISTLMRRVLNTDSIILAKVLVSDPQRLEETANEIDRALRAKHAISDGRPADFSLLTAVEVQRMAARVERILRLYLPLGSIVILLLSGAVTAALMLSSVSERVGEIGLRRAVGARTEDIRWQFLIETATTTLSGGLLGVLIAFIAARLAAERLHLAESFSWEAVLLGLIAAIATGLLAGVLPALKATQLRPADALR
jgi:putative ABC transport system permease protein